MGDGDLSWISGLVARQYHCPNLAVLLCSHSILIMKLKGAYSFLREPVIQPASSLQTN